MKGKGREKKRKGKEKEGKRKRSERKRKGKEKERKKSYIFIIYITFNITGGGLLVFFNDGLTTFRNKNYRFIFNIEKQNKLKGL